MIGDLALTVYADFTNQLSHFQDTCMYMIVGTLATKSFLAKDPYIVGLGLGNAQNVLGYSTAQN